MTSTSTYPISTIAKLLNLTDRRVQQLAKEGIVPKAIKGQYELVPCVQGYIEYLKKKSLEKDASQHEAYDAKVRLIKAQATKFELETGVITGNLLRAEEVKSTWESMIVCFRSVLLGVPNRLAFQLASVSDPQEIAALLKQSINEALEELSKDDALSDANVEKDNNNNPNNFKDNTNAEDIKVDNTKIKTHTKTNGELFEE